MGRHSAQHIAEATAKSKASNGGQGGGARIRWPDMSAYGLHFGLHRKADGKRQLIMIDENGSFSSMAKSMGMRSTRWVGMWVSDSLKFEIPNLSRAFPKAVIGNLLIEEIEASTRDRILSREHLRLSQRANQSKFSWHPTRVAPAAERIIKMFGGLPVRPSTEINEGSQVSAGAALQLSLIHIC